MGKRSKRGRVKSKSKPINRSLLEYEDFDSILAHEEELMALAEKDPAISQFCYLKLGGAYANNEEGDKAEMFMDRIVSMYNDNIDLAARGMDAHFARMVFSTYVMVFKLSSAMDVYKSQRLKGLFPMKEMLHLMGHMFATKNDEDIPLAAQILEDHMDAADEYTTELEKIHKFYMLLAKAHTDLNQHVKLNTCLKRRLEISRRMGDDHLQVKALLEISQNYRVMGEFDKAMSILDQCFELMSRIEGGGDVLDRASAFSQVGELIKVQSIERNRVILRSDAENALQMNLKACDLVTSAFYDSNYDNDISIMFPRSTYHQNVVKSYCDLGKYDECLDHAKNSIKVLDEAYECIKEMNDEFDGKLIESLGVPIINARSNAMLGTCRIYLRKFYHLQSLGQPFDSGEILNYAMACVQEANIDVLVPYTELMLVSAQVYYFCPMREAAYLYLAMFLDKQITSGKMSCGCCQHRSSKNAVTKICSHCNSTFYCSGTCQKLHWKTDNAGEVRHKLLCPLLKYWRKKWKKVLKEKEMNGELKPGYFRWSYIKEMNEHLTDTCRDRFEEFFKSLLDKKKKQESHIPVSIDDLD